MGSRELLLFSVILLASLLPSSSANGFSSVTGGYERRGTSSREQPSVPQWQLLTNRNFSSQIRFHQHILLMVTVPWYGESRSLMKEISHLVAIKQEELGHLSLMVVYRNSDKLLADVLGANEGITFLYYHHSMAYKYGGRLSAHNILSSVYQVMPLGLEDFPLKHLQTKEALDSFYYSTDKAILLLEFCGWSTKLLHKRKNESNGNGMYMQSFSENVGDLLDDQNRDANGTVILDNQEIYEDLENEELTCRVGMGLTTCPWAGEFTWVNESVSKGTRNGNPGLGLSCTQQEFQRFESFFTKFMSTAKEYSLPLERQRFGLVTETSLLPFLGVSDPETWLIVLQFPSCPNCSKVVQEVDDLHAVLKMDDSLVMELGVVDQNSQLAFPADRPSIILFVDRSSSSSEIKNASKLVLATFKQFARDCHLSTQVNNNSRASLSQVISGAWHKNTRDPFSHMKSKVSPANKLVKLKDDMAITIMNEGENTSLDDIASQAQSSQFYNILAELLHRREPSVKTKETKISLLAKEVGFQLLSDDFHVQVVDKLPSHTEEHTQPDKVIESDTVSLVDQNAKQPEESTEQSSDLSGYIAMNNEEIPELVHMEGDLQQNQEVVPYRESSTSTTDNEHMTVCQQEGSESTCSADNSSQSSQKSPLVEEHADKENVHNFDYSLSEVISSGFAKNLVHETSEVVLVEEGSSEHAKGSMEMVMSSEPFVGRRPFLGSFFFSDGNHQFLETMTASSRFPSLILLDPLLQQHYVLSEKENITYSSIANFIDQFLDGNLTPYQKSEVYLAGSRETPHPPFVNLDFREADSIPRVTAKSFCELIVGFKHCETKGKSQPSNTENVRPAYNVDVLVLFSTTWCGFCQRMELVVREVYRAFKSFNVLLTKESLRRNSRNIQENNEDTLIGLPSIYLLDCSLNDCGSFLLPLGKVVIRELYFPIYFHYKIVCISDD
ncbi:putative Thioredoxin-like superfamily [Dioscorea sansibarensis]